MPKENTHLFFADSLISQCDDTLKNILQKNNNYFYLGCIANDTFYYSTSKKLQSVGDYIHGKDGNPTNELIFLWLDEAKNIHSEKDASFIFGYITHCALDIIFHPVIYYFSGNYYDENPEKRRRSIYLHRHIETLLDAQLHHQFNFRDYVDLEILENLPSIDILTRRFEIKKEDILSAFQRQKYINIKLKNAFIYSMARLACFFSDKINRAELALSYFHKDRHTPSFCGKVSYKDLITGKEYSKTPQELFSEAEALALNMIRTAHAYYQGTIDIDKAKTVLRGESLNTGKKSCPVHSVKFTK